VALLLPKFEFGSRRQHNLCVVLHIWNHLVAANTPRSLRMMKPMTTFVSCLNCDNRWKFS